MCFPKENDLNFENFPPPADFPLCFHKENDMNFENSPPPADFPLRFPKVGCDSLLRDVIALPFTCAFNALRTPVLCAPCGCFK